MTIKAELADGTFEIFESGNYKLSTVKDFHPMICKVSIYDNGKKIKSVSRPFKWFYKHFTFKSKKVQETLKNLEKPINNEEIPEL